MCREAIVELVFLTVALVLIAFSFIPNNERKQ